MSELLKHVDLLPLDTTLDGFNAAVTARGLVLTEKIANLVDNEHHHGLLREAKNLAAIINDDDPLAEKITCYNVAVSTHNEIVTDFTSAFKTLYDLFGAAVVSGLVALVKKETGVIIDPSKVGL